MIYGRRRCGKSRLLQQLLELRRDVYYLADMRDGVVQREALAHEIARVVPRFDDVLYPDWSALLEAWMDRAPDNTILAIDEFPYLVRISPELPSILQRFVDGSGDMTLQLILCGSSQRIMHGLVLDRRAPLYGRASEIVKIEPLTERWVCQALGVNGVEAVEAYSVWGGLPRNWELAADCKNIGEAIKTLVLDRNGILHNEPPRLLLDDMRSAVQAHSILSLIGAGCHRIGEIAGRLGKPAGSLSRPLGLLVDLGYVRREVPFGENLRSTKRSIYKLADPFLSFWYRFVQPNESMLELDLIDAVYERIIESFPTHVGGIWEQMARHSATFLKADQIDWGPASRWWGKDSKGRLLRCLSGLLSCHTLTTRKCGYSILEGYGCCRNSKWLRCTVCFVRGNGCSPSRVPPAYQGY